MPPATSTAPRSMAAPMAAVFAGWCSSSRRSLSPGHARGYCPMLHALRFLQKRGPLGSAEPLVGIESQGGIAYAKSETFAHIDCRVGFLHSDRVHNGYTRRPQQEKVLYSFNG